MNHKASLDNFPTLPEAQLTFLPREIQNYVHCLHAAFLSVMDANRRLTEEVADLKARLAKDSTNSHKPPSNEGMRKPKSQRTPSGKPPGGQPGHPGSTLMQVSDPHDIQTHVPTHCHLCHASLEEVVGTCVAKRQVFESSQPGWQLHVTEHCVEKKICPHCGAASRGQFPSHVRAPVQYGAGTRSLIAYLQNYQYLPLGRTVEALDHLFGFHISKGTCAHIAEELFRYLDPFECALKARLIGARILHADETGVRCEKTLQWVHVASTQLLTLYYIHKKRGQEAMDEAGVIPCFSGTLMHDFWRSYLAYCKAKHGLCNAHLIRELTFVHEERKEGWAKKMKNLLHKAWQKVQACQAQGPPLSKEDVQAIEFEYTKIVSEGFEYHAGLPSLPRGKRGKQKQRDGKNLLDRLHEMRECVLRFLYDLGVPFTNNQGEQDIRMMKLKQKISGCFRSFTGGQYFCRIRSYLSTARKQGWAILDALVTAFSGNPRMDFATCPV
jgi:transposase